MLRTRLLSIALTMIIQLTFSLGLTSPCGAQEWQIRKPRGTIKVVEMFNPTGAAMLNYAEGLVTTDRDNHIVPCLAKDWRWIDDRTIEFKLREDVRFHNGEQFNAKAVETNWNAYKALKNPRVVSTTNLPDDTKFEIISNFLVRFTLPEPDGLALAKFNFFLGISCHFTFFIK